MALGANGCFALTWTSGNGQSGVAKCGSVPAASLRSRADRVVGGAVQQLVAYGSAPRTPLQAS